MKLIQSLNIVLLTVSNVSASHTHPHPCNATEYQVRKRVCSVIISKEKNRNETSLYNVWEFMSFDAQCALWQTPEECRKHSDSTPHRKSSLTNNSIVKTAISCLSPQQVHLLQVTHYRTSGFCPLCCCWDSTDNGEKSQYLLTSQGDI